MARRTAQQNQLIDELRHYYSVRAYSDIQLANLLGVHRATINRNRQMMEKELGLPFIEEGRGRYRLDPQFRVSNVQLNPQESLALYLGGRRLQQQTKTGQRHVASALEKLADVLKKPMMKNLTRAAQVVLEQEQDPLRVAVMEKLVEGWMIGRKVRIRHHTLRGQPREYLVSPYQLEPAVWGDGVYLIGESDFHGGVATFKVERIEHATVTMEPYTIPEDFDSHTLLQHAWGIWHADKEPQPVRLQFSRYVTPRVKESIWHPSQTILVLPDGSCVWEAKIAEIQEMEPWVRGWGSDVTVLIPDELREKIIADVQRSSRNYGIVASADSLDDRLLRLWGKTDKKRDSEYHPALYHMLDVGYVAQQLLRPSASPRWRNVLARSLNAEVDSLHEWLPWLIALHDIGKISVPFQVLNDTQQKRLQGEGFDFGSWKVGNKSRLHHTIVGRITLETELQHLPEALRIPLWEMVSGHHGYYQQVGGAQEEDFELLREPAEWQALRQRTLQILANVLLQNEPSVWPEPEHLSAAIVALNGFTILCDWLGSDEQYFKPAAHLSLLDYLPRSRQKAEQRAASAGFFEPVQSKKPTRFAELFSEITEPRPLQLAIDQIPVDWLAEPSLTIIEAPTGEGKTEAALALAHRIAAATKSDELYFALPTMATSNAMYERLQEHLRDRLALPFDLLQLVHGQNFLVEDDLRLAPLDNGDGRPHPALSWLQPKRKALLAPFGVGTIDQAEMAALNVRFNALRLIGLAGKVVILDEVHAYDAYMLAIIERMVQWLSALGSSVVLLSATLPRATLRRLMQAYSQGIVWQMDEDSLTEPDYPSLLISGRSQPIPYQCFPKAYQPHKTIHLQWLNMEEEAWQEKAQWLLAVVAEGGCVCWIANTVDRAQKIYQALLGNLASAGIDCTLFHARFPLADRQETEQAIKAKYGKEGRQRPQRGIVVGTQVLEQSLDLDFDVMMSDLAPIDLLLQRAGRLHRHERNGRPPAHAEPRFYVNCELAKDELLKLGRDRFYAEYIMRQTWETIRERDRLTLPADYRPLVEAVYHEEPPPATSPLHEAWEKLKRERELLADEAEPRLTREPKPDDIFTRGKKTFRDDEEDNAWLAAKTRWGQLSVTVIPLLLEGGQMRLVPTTQRLPLDRELTRKELFDLLGRTVRISSPGIAQRLNDEKGTRQAAFGDLFTKTPLLKHCVPLRLEATEEEGLFTSPDLPLSMDHKLGIVIQWKK